MRILVTGAGGYIGSVLTGDLLQAGHRVVGLDTFSYGKNSLLQCCAFPSFTFVQGDVRDARLMRAWVSQCDLIVALAALARPQSCTGREAEAREVNVESISMLNEVRSASQPLLFMSTNIGYGTKERKAVYTEADPLEPNSTYGQTKVAAEKIVAEKEGFVIYRPASAFGISPRMQDHLLLNYYVQRAIVDGYIDLYDAGCRRNFIHVRDISRAIQFTIEHFGEMKDELYNLGLSDPPMTKLEIASRIKAHLPDLRVICDERATDQDRRDYVICNAKVEAKGFQCAYSIDHGIAELTNYYRMRELIQAPCCKSNGLERAS